MNGELIWEDFLVNHKIKESAVEYIDSSEQDTSLIAMNSRDLKDETKKQFKYTHCEIHPVNYFWYFGSVVSHFRNIINHLEIHISVLWVNKQWGCIRQIFENRMDKTAYVQTYPMQTSCRY